MGFNLSRKMFENQLMTLPEEEKAKFKEKSLKDLKKFKKPNLIISILAIIVPILIILFGKSFNVTVTTWRGTETESYTYFELFDIAKYVDGAAGTGALFASVLVALVAQVAIFVLPFIKKDMKQYSYYAISAIVAILSAVMQLMLWVFLFALAYVVKESYTTAEASYQLIWLLAMALNVAQYVVGLKLASATSVLDVLNK